MGIYINGIDMPAHGIVINIYADGRVSNHYDENCKQIATATAVPPHGDLIDRDAFVAAQRHLYCDNCDRRRGMKDGKLTKKFVYAIGDAPCRACDIDDVLDSLEDYAPTIIEGDKE